MGQNQRPRKGRLDLLVQDVIMCSENPIKASTPTAAQDEVSTPKPASRRIWGRTNSIRVNGAEVFCFFPGGSLPNPCPKRRFESWYAVDSHKLNPREIGDFYCVVVFSTSGIFFEFNTLFSLLVSQSKPPSSLQDLEAWPETEIFYELALTDRFDQFSWWVCMSWLN